MSAALHSLLAPIVSPWPLVMADANAPRPPKPFATLAVNAAEPIGRQVERPVDEAGIIEVVEYRELSVEVQFFGPGCFETAQTVGLRVRLPSQVERAETLGVAVASIARATGVSALLNESQFEERGILEFTAYATEQVDDDVGLIEHAILTEIPDPATNPPGTPEREFTIDAP
jgi:hypothetical protein